MPTDGIYTILVQGQVGRQGEYLLNVSENIAPRIDALVGPLTGTKVDTFAFEASVEDAEEAASALTYEWDFGDGVRDQGVGMARSPAHVYAGPGVYRVALRASDSEGGHRTAYAEVLGVVPENRPPAVLDDAAVTFNNAPVVLQVLDNDTDPDGDLLSIGRIGVPTRGNATHTSTAITYTPEQSYVGLVRIEYVVEDGHGGSDQGAAEIEVQADVRASVEVISATVRRIRFDVQPGWTYTVQYRDELAAGDWQVLAGAPHDTGEAVDEQAPGETKRYYRLVIRRK